MRPINHYSDNMIIIMMLLSTFGIQKTISEVSCEADDTTFESMVCKFKTPTSKFCNSYDIKYKADKTFEKCVNVETCDYVLDGARWRCDDNFCRNDKAGITNKNFLPGSLVPTEGNIRPQSFQECQLMLLEDENPNSITCSKYCYQPTRDPKITCGTIETSRLIKEVSNPVSTVINQACTLTNFGSDNLKQACVAALAPLKQLGVKDLIPLGIKTNPMVRFMDTIVAVMQHRDKQMCYDYAKGGLNYNESLIKNIGARQLAYDKEHNAVKRQSVNANRNSMTLKQLKEKLIIANRSIFTKGALTKDVIASNNKAMDMYYYVGTLYALVIEVCNLSPSTRIKIVGVAAYQC